MTQTTQESYIDRIGRVLSYIADHLDEDMSVDDLAEVACFSSYHFHRIFRGLVGETVTQTVKRLRLHRAAGELIRSSADVSDIAKRAGYGSVEAFSRAFKATYKEAPVRYRMYVRETPFSLMTQNRKTGMFTVEIKNLPDHKMAAIPHVGDYMEIDKAFQAIFMWGLKQQLVEEQSAGVALYFDDPSQVPTDKLRSEAGFMVTQPVEDAALGVRTLDITAGRYAVLRFKGPYAELEGAYDYLFGTWLAATGEKPAAQPVMEMYLNDPRTTEPSELLTDICVALA